MLRLKRDKLSLVESTEELYLGLIIEYNQSQEQVFTTQLGTYAGLSLFLTVYIPKYLPFFWVYYNRYKLSIFYLRSSLLTLSLLIHIASIFIVAYELFTILCTIESLNKFSSNPIHKGTIVSSFDLANMVFADFIFI